VRRDGIPLDLPREMSNTRLITRTKMMAHREVRLDLRVHPLLAIQKTAAALAERAVVYIETDGADAAIVRFADRADVTIAVDPVAEFMSLLHDVTLQDRIANQTKEIRHALLQAALFEALKPPK